MYMQALALAGLTAFAALAAAPAQAQPVDLAVESVEVRGDPVPGGQLSVTARIRRRDSGPPDSVLAIVRFQSPGDDRPLADRRITLTPGAQEVVTLPWTARIGRHSMSVAVGTNAAVDGQPRNNTLTTRAVIVYARGARNAPQAERWQARRRLWSQPVGSARQARQSRRWRRRYCRYAARRLRSSQPAPYRSPVHRRTR